MGLDGYLITGATGFLGDALLDASTALGLPIIPLGGISHDKSRQFRGRSIPSVDLSVPNAVEEWVRATGAKPRGIIHAAALSDARRCEENPAAALAMNSDSVRHLMSVFPNVPFLFVSTDLVFDGHEDAPSGGFSEQALPKPRSHYANSKRKGEQLTLASPLGLVVRVSLLYGRKADTWGGFVGWMLKELALGHDIPLFLDEYRTPVWTEDVAKTLLSLLCRFVGSDFSKLGDHRVLHLAGPESLNRVEFAERVLHQLGGNLKQLKPCLRESISLIPDRPRNVSLSSELAQTLLGFQPHSVVAALSNYAV